jgi:uncharacterized protein
VVPCGLCLRPARISIDAPIHMTFTAEAEEEPTADDPLDDIDVGRHDGHTLDLQPTLRELFILALPIAPRCEEGCRGLCPTCGANRNDPRERDCGHEEVPRTDPRFLALKDVKLS